MAARSKDIMYAVPYESKRIASWDTMCIQPKLNGQRCLASNINGTWCLESSQKTPITSMPHILEVLNELGTEFEEFQLDGELYKHGMKLQEILSYTKRRRPRVGFEDIGFHVFDLKVPKDIDYGFAKRYEILCLALDSIQGGLEVADTKVHEVPTRSVEASQEMFDLELQHFMNLHYEGIIVRHPQAPYENRRSPFLLKYKPTKLDYYEIVGYKEEMDLSGNLKGSLGSIEVVASDGNTFFVGSGTCLTREERLRLWNIRDDLIGRIAEVKYPEKTNRGVPSHGTLVDIKGW